MEVNFDGIVGPTHNYGGLSYGNTASENNRYIASNPCEAALQGLEKMKFLFDMGIQQAVLPPQERPFLTILRQIGYKGNDREIIKTVFKDNPAFLLSVSSAACMWTANAATASPSIDSLDRHVHLTSANLTINFHRSIEGRTTSKILKTIFDSPQHFIHHESLPSGSFFLDEGAANHTRFCQSHGKKGVQLFIFGKYALQDAHLPKKYPARQTFEASSAIARLHELEDSRIIFGQQHPDAIDAGAFHNDVVSVGNENVFLFHEKAFVEKEKLLSEIRKKVAEISGKEMIFLEVNEKDISLKDAVTSYLFNSQLISRSDDTIGMILLAPVECQDNPKIKAYVDSLLASKENPIQEVQYLNLRQSMQNGGGPACLRLRVVLTEEERAATLQGVFFSQELYHALKKWIMKNYRDRLELIDFGDPQLHEEGNRALDELTRILGLGSIYSFQL